MNSLILRTVTVLAMIPTAFAVVMACPACKDSFGAGENASIGEAYSWSILFMLGVPLTIVSVATVVVARRVRRNPNNNTEVNN